MLYNDCDKMVNFGMNQSHLHVPYYDVRCLLHFERRCSYYFSLCAVSRSFISYNVLCEHFDLKELLWVLKQAVAAKTRYMNIIEPRH